MRAFAFLANILIVVFSTSFSFACETQAQIITITATVGPQRIIVVDRNSTIQRIISNTKQDLQPKVVLESPNGQEFAYSEGIAQQYEFLKSSLSFSKPGIIYQREVSPHLLAKICGG